MIYHVATVNDDIAVYLLLILTSIKYRLKGKVKNSIYINSICERKEHTKSSKAIYLLMVKLFMILSFTILILHFSKLLHLLI